MSISQRNRVELGSLLSLWSIQLWISGPVFFSKHEVSPVQWPLDPIIKWMVTLDHPHHYCINEKMGNNSNASHYWASHGPQMGNNVNDCYSPESWIESFFFCKLKLLWVFFIPQYKWLRSRKQKTTLGGEILWKGELLFHSWQEWKLCKYYGNQRGVSSRS